MLPPVVLTTPEPWFPVKCIFSGEDQAAPAPSVPPPRLKVAAPLPEVGPIARTKAAH